MNLALRLAGIWLIYAIFQITLLDNMVIGHTARSFVFLLFLLMLPANMSKPAQYLIAFGAGLFIDIFAQMPGLHAFSSLLMIGIRPFWINVITGTVNRSKEELNFNTQSLSWIASYLLPLIFIHHLSFFTLEAAGSVFPHFFTHVLKIIGSTLFTFSLCFLIFGVFYKRSYTRR